MKLEKLKLDLNVEWKISRNSTNFKENYILSHKEHQSEVAPNIRYGETPEHIEKSFSDFLNNPKVLENDEFPRSLKNAILNLELKSTGDIYQILSLKRIESIKTSFSIPIMESKNLKDYLKERMDFKVYKCKIANTNELSLLKTLASLVDVPIRVDANEGFQSLEDYLHFQSEIKGLNIEFIEQPFPAARKDLYLQLKGKSLFPIFADESVEDDFNGDEFQKMFDGINIKLMKAGGIERSKQLLEKARKYHLKTMLGCMIETSLGIREAMYLAELVDYFDLDGHLFLKDDPYKNLLEIKNGILCLNS